MDFKDKVNSDIMDIVNNQLNAEERKLRFDVNDAN